MQQVFTISFCCIAKQKCTTFWFENCRDAHTSSLKQTKDPLKGDHSEDSCSWIHLGESLKILKF